MMTVELISTGSELVTGEVVNTNAAWLATALRERGIAVARHVIVGDDLAAIGRACREAAARAQVVIVTGGLGPTSDDITLEAFARAFGRPMQFDPARWEAIQAGYASRGRECADINRRMATFPEGATMFINTVGTACGVQAPCDAATFFFLPGVPAEMEQLFTDHISPWLATQPGAVMRRRVLQCFGLPEASIGARIEALALADVDVGYRVRFPETTVKLIARGADVAQLDARLDTAERQVRAALGDVIYGTGDDTLPQVVVARLCARQATVAVAESCTGGRLCSLLVGVPGASACFREGVICYSDAAKQRLLGIPDALLQQHGAVSEPVACAMALQAREQAGATYGIGITGIAGPGGGTPDKPVGTVLYALATKQGTTVRHALLPMARNRFRTLVSGLALDALRRELS